MPLVYLPVARYRAFCNNLEAEQRKRASRQTDIRLKEALSYIHMPFLSLLLTSRWYSMGWNSIWLTIGLIRHTLRRSSRCATEHINVWEKENKNMYMYSSLFIKTSVYKGVCLMDITAQKWPWLISPVKLETPIQRMSPCSCRSSRALEHHS